MFVWKDKDKPEVCHPGPGPVQARSRPVSEPAASGRPPASPVPRHHLAAIVAENTATRKKRKEERQQEGGEATGRRRGDRKSSDS